jgi:hypothetical protein
MDFSMDLLDAVRAGHMMMPILWILASPSEREKNQAGN